ncbi:MAG: hypothetical protein IAI50_12135 [Candidatus Eremiobacteraeota bacterium]|nr:hypothetical protein [Candidatus Eremiobacteraeota bacterium]
MLYRNARFAAASGAAALLLAACSGGGGSPTSNSSALQPQSLQMRPASKARTFDSVTGRIGLPPGFHGLLTRAHDTSPSWLSEEASSPIERLYVSDADTDDVYIYNTAKLSKPIGTITGLDEPLGSFVDAKGNFYVANLGTSTVLEYPKGSKTASKTYSTGLSDPIGVAVGSDGTVYVSEFEEGAVVVYAPGKMTPAYTLSISEPEGVTLDSKNNLYVSYNNANTGTGAVEKFAPKAKTGKDLGISVEFTGDIKINKSGDIILEDQDNQAVNFYKPGATSPYGSISAGVDTYKLALNSAETLLYIGDFSTSVPVYDAKPSGKLVESVTGLEAASGVSLSPAPPL